MHYYLKMKKTNFRNTIKRTGLAIIVSGSAVIFSFKHLPAQPEQHSTILDDINFKPIRFKPTRISTQTIAGRPIYQITNSSLPFIKLSLHFNGRGLAVEKISNAGLLEQSLHAMENGGAGELGSQEVARRLSELGARISFDAETEAWSASLIVLKKDFDVAFKILSDSLLKPRLDENAIAVGLQNKRRAIQHRNDRPASIARRKLAEAMYAGTRQGYSLQEKDLDRINASTIKKHLPFLLSRNELSIALSGDIMNVDVHGPLTKLVQSLPTGTLTKPPTMHPVRNDRIYLIDKPVTQTVIAAGTFLPAHRNPDYYAMQVGNYILGGGSFNSRLMREIRVKRGLAYYAYSYNSWLKNNGRFIAGTATRTPKAAESLKIFLNEIAGMHNGGTEAEISLARQSILNGLVFEFDTPEKRVANEIRFRRHLMPLDYLTKFPSNIRAVRKQDIQHAYKKYINADALHIIIVGPAALKEQLSKIRPVVIMKPEDAFPTK